MRFILTILVPRWRLEQVDGTFATIIIILPSDFTGGNIRLSYGGLSPDINCIPESVLSTTVLSWYRGVTHEMAPITSGYKLALSYKLIHTVQDTLRPAPHDTTELVNQLRRILLSWTAAPDKHPMMIVSLLDSACPSKGLQGSVLNRNDAKKAAILQSLAQQHGFCLGLVDLKCRQIGYAEDREPFEWGPTYSDEGCACGECDFDDRDDGYGEYEYEYDEEIDPHDLEMRDEEEVEVLWTARQLVRFQGPVVVDKFGREMFNKKEAVTIPKDLSVSMINGRPNTVKYDGYDGPVSLPPGIECLPYV